MSSKITINVKRDYGVTVAEFSVTVDNEPSGDVSGEDLARRASDLARMAILEFERNSLTTLKPPPRTKEAEYERLEIEVTGVSLEIQNGVERFRALSNEPRYSKYGVPVYPEIIEKYPILALSQGQYKKEFSSPLKGVVLVGTKYSKLVEIISDEIPF